MTKEKQCYDTVTHGRRGSPRHQPSARAVMTMPIVVRLFWD